MSSKYAVFEINGEEYGMDVIEVSTIEKGLSIKKMANSPDNVKVRSTYAEMIFRCTVLEKRWVLKIRADKDTRFLITDVNKLMLQLRLTV